MNHETLIRIMAGEEQGPLAGVLRLGLSALTPGYRLAISVRNMMFNSGLRKSARLPRPALSVGNLTTGGTGKTPMVIELARRLAEQGSRPAVLLRGYMANAKTGPSDEAQQLRDELGSSVPIEPNPSRIQAAGRVIEKNPGAEVSVFLLDDGFQHRQVHRDLDLVLIDATRPFGFDRLLPRGLLREPARNLRRADAVIVTRSDQVDPKVLAALDKRIQELTGRPPTAHSVHRWNGFRQDDQTLPPDHLKPLSVVGVSAIGNPKAFERTLADTAGRVLTCLRFDDHHPYTAGHLQELLAKATQDDAQAVVTTEKDWVKWRPLIQSLNITAYPPILRPILGIGFIDGGQALDNLLHKALHA